MSEEKTNIFNGIDDFFHQYATKKQEKVASLCFDYGTLPLNEQPKKNQNFICGYKPSPTLNVQRMPKLNRNGIAKKNAQGKIEYTYVFSNIDTDALKTELLSMLIDLVGMMNYVTHSNAIISDCISQNSAKNNDVYTSCVSYNKNNISPYVMTENNFVIPDVNNSEPMKKKEHAFVLGFLRCRIGDKTVYQHFMTKTPIANKLLERYNYTKKNFDEVCNVFAQMLNTTLPNKDDYCSPKVYVHLGNNKYIYCIVQTNISLLFAVNDLITMSNKKDSDTIYFNATRKVLFKSENYGVGFTGRSLSMLTSLPPRLGNNNRSSIYSAKNFFSVI